MKSGLAFRGRLRGELGVVGQEIDLTHQALREWQESEHTIEGAHTDITAETLEVDGVTSFGGRWLMPQSAVITPPYTLTANQNDYNPRDLGSAIWLRLSTDASREITGIVTVDKDEFRHLILTNVGNFDIVLKHNNTSSQAIYRIGNPMSADLTMGSGSSVWMLYDAHAGNWRVINGAGDVAGLFTTSGGTAPDNAQYIVAAANVDLTAERVATDTTTVSWDFGTAAQAKANVVDDSISNTKLANMAAWTIKMRNNAASGDPQDQTLADVTEEAAPASGDMLLGWESGGAIRKFDVSNIASEVGYWSPLTNGDPYAPELIMSNGDTIAVFTPL